VAYLADLFFSPISRSISYRIHANEDVGTGLVLLSKPALKRLARYGLSGKNPLHGLVAIAIPDQDRRMVIRLVESEHIFRRGQESRQE
jgi:hypothetical protein